MIEPQPAAGAVWAPTFGSQAGRFLAHQDGISEPEKARLAAEALSILGACQEPGVTGARTVLAVGRIQSGKTLSFEALTALARDNGFALVIILAGISKFLEMQTRRRITTDFQLETEPDACESWSLTSSSPLLSGGDQDLPRLLNAWEAWPDRREMAGEEAPPTIVLVALKHYAHIDALATVIPRFSQVPALIIDDESDQASLNGSATRQGRPATTTYRSITELRSRLASHTYVQYTATPQANLLLAAADTLAPDAVRLVTPGSAYVGNDEFFLNDLDRVEGIPDNDAGVFEKDTHVTEPPGTLIAAIDYFVVAAAVGRHRAREASTQVKPTPISMLVHPARLVREHSKAARWVRARIQALENLDDEGLAEALAPALTDLQQHGTGDADMDASLLVGDVRRTLQLLGVLVLNRSDEGWAGAPGEDIPWATKYAWIVVGGQMVDRGLTLPGLAITYMPRTPGRTGDTVQQRARWLGYKRQYLDRCRLWLTNSSSQFFEDYTEHERYMHEEIERIVAEGETLKEWRRRFLLDPRWHLTRSNVISRTMHQRQLLDWEQFTSLGDGSPPSDATLAAYEGLLTKVHSFRGTTGEEHEHPYFDCSLTEAFDVVEGYPVLDPLDAEDTKALLLAYISRQIDTHGDDPSRARVYLMNDCDPAKPRKRSAAERDGRYEILRLPQGRNNQYPGDRSIRKATSSVPMLTLQLHRVQPTTDKRNGPPLWPDKTMLALAVHIPAGTDPGWVIEAQ